MKSSKQKKQNSSQKLKQKAYLLNNKLNTLKSTMKLKQNTPSRLALSKINQSAIVNLMGIKCAQCSLIYPQDMIEQHLISHIQPKYLMPYQQKTGAKKLQTKIQLTEQTQTIKSSDIASLHTEAFPKSQTLRKNIKPPSQFGIIVHDLPQIKKDLVSYKNDEKDKTSIIGGLVVEKDKLKKQKLFHGVGLDKEETILGGKQEISLYRSNLFGSIPLTQRIKTGKKVNPFQQPTSLSQRTQQYELLPIKEDKGLLKGELPQQGQNLLVVNVRKHKQLTPRHETIITSSAKKPKQASTATPTKFTNSRLEPFTTSNFDATSRMDFSRYQTNQFQCEQCHGFYCQHCKSTIPPIYRPWNIDNLDPKIVQFYKQHVYKKNCEDCDKNLK